MPEIVNIATKEKQVLGKTPFSVRGRYYVSVANTYESIVDIAGKGFLDMMYYTNQSSEMKLKITIDGVVIYEARGYGNDDTELGIVSLNQQEPIIPYITIDYPYVDGDTSMPGTQALIFIKQPIFFSSSLLIELQNSSTSDICYYKSYGGVE